MDPALSYRGLRMEQSRKLSESFENPSIRQRDEANQFALEMDHMSLRLIQNQPVFTPGEEGRHNVNRLQSIYGAANARTTITLPQPDGLDLYRGPLPESPNQ